MDTNQKWSNIEFFWTISLIIDSTINKLVALVYI